MNKLAIGFGIFVVLGFVVILFAATWNRYERYEERRTPDTEAATGEDAGGQHEDKSTNAEAEHHETHETGEHAEEDEHHETYEMGEHVEEEGEHHEAMAEPGDYADRPLSGTMRDGVRVVEVKARQFAFDPAVIVVGMGEKIRLEVTSQDVTHGIDIEDFGIDKRLPPQETVTVEFTADKAGPHHFHCSVFCGKGHEDMHGTLVVREEAASP